MHSLTKQFLSGIQQLKASPDTPTVSGVYKQVFGILVSSALGEEIDLSAPKNLDKVREGLEKLSSVSGRLDDLSQVYKVAKNQCGFGIHELRLDRNRGVPETQLRSKSVDLIAKSVAHVTITTNLPETHSGNTKIIERSSGQIYSRENITLIPNLSGEFKTIINETVKDSGAVPLPGPVVENVSNKAAEAIKKPSNNIKILAAAALLTSLLGAKLETDLPHEEVPEKDQEEREESGVSGHALGFGLGLGMLAKEEKEQKREETPKEPSKIERVVLVQETTKKQLASQPSGLKSLFSSVFNTFAGLFKKSLNLGVTALSGGTSKLLQGALKAGGKLLSLLGGIFGQVGQTDVGDTLKKISIAVLLFVLLPIFLIFGLSFLDVGVLRPTALVSSPLTSPTPASFTTLAPISISPTPSSLTSLVPEGWPTQTGCVYVGPNGSTTHTGTTAQSIDVVSPNAYGRAIGKISRGLPVYATLDGIVSMVAEGYPPNQFVSDLGNRVEICHVDDFNTQYPYNSRRPFNCKGRVARYGHFLTTNPNLRVGAQVKKGGFLGTIDETGYSSIGDHVHYELRGFGNILSSLSISQLLKNSLEGCFGWSRCPKVCW